MRKDPPEALWVRQLRTEVRVRLRARGVPQRSLAAHLGISEKRMSGLLNGAAAGSPELLERMARAVGLRIAVTDSAVIPPDLPGHKPRGRTKRPGPT